MTPTLSPELLACPFCGSPAEMQPWHGGGPDKQLVDCSSTECEPRPAVTGETPAEAIAAWNRRAPSAASAIPAELLADLKAKAEAIGPVEWHAGHLCRDDHPCDCAYIFDEAHAGGIATVHVSNDLPISEGGNDAPDLELAKLHQAFIAAANPATILALIAEIERRDQGGVVVPREPTRSDVAKAFEAANNMDVAIENVMALYAAPPASAPDLGEVVPASNGSPFDREIDRYWQKEAAAAYDERRDEISLTLAENGGVIEPWMAYSITPKDLAALLTKIEGSAG